MIFPSSENSLHTIDIEKLDKIKGLIPAYAVRIRTKSDNKVVCSLYVQTLRHAAKLGRIVAHELDAMAEELPAEETQPLQMTLDL